MSTDKKTCRIKQSAECYASPVPIVGIELDVLSAPGGRAPEEDGLCMAVKVGGGVITILLVAAYACYTRARGQFDALIRRKRLFLPLWTVALAKGVA